MAVVLIAQREVLFDMARQQLLAFLQQASACLLLVAWIAVVVSRPTLDVLLRGLRVAMQSSRVESRSSIRALLSLVLGVLVSS